jgi:hypothetical protein
MQIGQSIRSVNYYERKKGLVRTEMTFERTDEGERTCAHQVSGLKWIDLPEKREVRSG